LIVAVSDDVPLNNEELLLWGIFTRFDCSRDLLFANCRFEGARPVYTGPMGIDATWKTGYPEALVMPDDIRRHVDQHWEKYGNLEGKMHAIS